VRKYIKFRFMSISAHSVFKKIVCVLDLRGIVSCSCSHLSELCFTLKYTEILS
jgi:hypothetical protein